MVRGTEEDVQVHPVKSGPSGPQWVASRTLKRPQSEASSRRPVHPESPSRFNQHSSTILAGKSDSSSFEQAKASLRASSGALPLRRTSQDLPTSEPPGFSPPVQDPASSSQGGGQKAVGEPMVTPPASTKGRRGASKSVSSLLAVEQPEPQMRQFAAIREEVQAVHHSVAAIRRELEAEKSLLLRTMRASFSQVLDTLGEVWKAKAANIQNLPGVGTELSQSADEIQRNKTEAHAQDHGCAADVRSTRAPYGAEAHVAQPLEEVRKVKCDLDLKPVIDEIRMVNNKVDISPAVASAIKESRAVVISQIWDAQAKAEASLTPILKGMQRQLAQIDTAPCSDETPCSSGRCGCNEELAFDDPPAPDIVRIVQTHFPGAMKGADVTARLFRTIKEYGLTRKNTIYGQSVCSDEINSDPGHLTTILTKHYGRTFPLGGIGGAPYGGKTGFMAFSHHVPDGGHVLVVFGPHVGFSPSGEPGRFLRRGQTKCSASCGAVIAAQSQLTSGTCMPADPKDLMQSWLREKLEPVAAEVAQSSNMMVDLARRAYDAVEAEMLSIINTNYGPGNLVLLGGIQINMPYPYPGFFMPCHFSLRSSKREPLDLMPALCMDSTLAGG
mmetsp:Transcript_65851/g.204181  ORF Transcript_65851/g.204181 Transcript_65851/m.204181 type:complete len:612 (-) Transcript_65851:160-1995(-)